MTRSLTSGLLATCGLLIGGFAASAEARVILTETNTIAADRFTSVMFVASGNKTRLSVGGYQLFFVEGVTDNSVFALSSGANLLRQNWDFTPAAYGSDAFQESSGSMVSNLFFAGTQPGSYDIFSQTFATNLGQSYEYDFSYTNVLTPSGLQVSVDAVANGVPELQTWAMMLLGSGMLGLVGYSRSRSRRTNAMVAA